MAQTSTAQASTLFRPETEQPTVTARPAKVRGNTRRDAQSKGTQHRRTGSPQLRRPRSRMPQSRLSQTWVDQQRLISIPTEWQLDDDTCKLGLEAIERLRAILSSPNTDKSCADAPADSRAVPTGPSN